MKSYRQFCALSRALDVIGDRWSLLIVRELLISPSRYSDLQRALPGIASNLLAQRLRTLEDDGVITSRAESAPVSAKVYSLTAWGHGLRGPLVEMARWGAPLMMDGSGDDHTRGRWLVFAIMALYPEPRELPDDAAFPAVRLRIDTDGDSLLLVAGDSGVHTSPATDDPEVDAVISGDSEAVFALLAGQHTAPTAVSITGNEDALRRVRSLTSMALPATQTRTPADHG
ncbi:winged helix-turn-helix transcriptional regulator [Gordonia sp. KTR9]|uniref:winged helix-turn-helix transcriptional regulator n=1 Tax=Gordonia sp. KTR9 TaxID=337191 RepID=UPI00027DE051|nr:helix-turn-helix domain-containing protein [Gordonia sp. KTR9]AFR50681.1 putative transcriptional regulators [Gordonia sp. KTR9]